MHRLLSAITVGTTLLFGVGLAQAHTPPHATDGFWADHCSSCHGMPRTAATLKVMITRPTSSSNETIAALRAFLDRVAEETTAITGRPALIHPIADIPCTACHLTGGVGRTQHQGLVLNEADPELSCGSTAGCHTLTRAGRIPWWVQPNVQLENRGTLVEGALDKVKALVAYAQTLHGELTNPESERLQGLPPFTSASVDVETFGSAVDYHIAPNWNPTFEHVASAPIPSAVVTALAPELYALMDVAREPFIATATALTATFQGKTNRARTLEEQLAVFQAMPETIAPLLTTIAASMVYSGTTLSSDQVTAIAAEIDALFPDATRTSTSTTRPAWSVPIPDSLAAGTISLRNSQMSFTNIPARRYPSIFRFMDHVQQTYNDADTISNYAAFTWTYKALTNVDKAQLATAAEAFEASSASGDLKLTLALATGSGEAPTAPEQTTLPALDQAQDHPANIRKLKALLTYDGSFGNSSVTTESVTTAYTTATDVTRDGVVDPSDYNAVRALLGQAATGHNGPYDLNGNGKIDVGDLRAVVVGYDCPKGICQ